MSTENWLARLAIASSAVLSLTIPGTGLAEAELSQPVVVSSVTTLLKLSGATVLVCLVFWAAARVMKQLQGMNAQSRGRLRIVESLSVGQRERVLIIEAGAEQMVIGVTGHQINMLHTLAEPLEQVGSTKDATLTHDFGKKLQSALKRHASV